MKQKQCAIILTLLASALSMPSFAQDQPPAPTGAFEVSGARLGMSVDLALKSIAATKPDWAAQIQAQASDAARDCASQGRSSLILAFAAGQPSAILELRCAQAPQNPTATSIELKSRPGPGLAAQDVKSALAGRYGQPTSATPLWGGGFELVWQAPSSPNPAAPQGEALLARLAVNPVDGSPTSLLLSLSANSVAKLTTPVATGLPF